jgi:hypothetical protein
MTPTEHRRWMLHRLHYQQMLNRLALADLTAGRAACKRLGAEIARLPAPRRRRKPCPP